MKITGPLKEWADEQTQSQRAAANRMITKIRNSKKPELTVKDYNYLLWAYNNVLKQEVPYWIPHLLKTMKKNEQKEKDLF